MGPIALFGIENDGLNQFVNLLVLFLFAIWIALIFWTYADARRRITDPMLVGCAVAASCFPLIGTIVYMIVRPPEYLEDVRERAIEVEAAEARLLQLRGLTCRFCGHPAERSFLRCPNCLKRLREPCPNCRKPLDPRWKVCPYCDAEVVPSQPEPEPQPQRRRRERQAANAAAVEAARGTAQSAGAPATQPARPEERPAARRSGATDGSRAKRPAAGRSRPPAR